MPRNIEIKARINSVATLLPEVRRIAERGPWDIHQDDTYFHCEGGRLKLRAFSAQSGELIYYRRERQATPKESHYVCSPTAAPDSLREALTLAYGELARIRKQRLLFLRGRTRIHLDVVAGLGEFLELEVVLAADEPASDGSREARELLAQLSIDGTVLIAGGYLELLQGGT
jgi:predicted adenylyl cyclase CyaB